MEISFCWQHLKCVYKVKSTCNGLTSSIITPVFIRVQRGSTVGDLQITTEYNDYSWYAQETVGQ